MTSAWTLIQKVVLTSSNSQIAFNSIPQTYSDLMIFYSLRQDGNSIDPSNFYFNADNGANYEMRIVYNGSPTGTATNTSYLSQHNNWAIFWMNSPSTTANTFCNAKVYIPNYTNTVRQKVLLVDGVTENNSASNSMSFGAGRWRNTAAINAITIQAFGNFVQNSSATLYGITRGSSGGVTVS